MPDALRNLDDHVRVVEPNGVDDVVHEFGGEPGLQLRIKAWGCV